MSYILGIDQGTTGTTVVLFDKQGNVKAKEYSEITQYYPKPGWVEHDADEIWLKTFRLIKLIKKNHDIKFSEIHSIGITNQRETTVIWEKKSGRPIHRAIVWQCRRTAKYCESLKSKKNNDLVKEKTGLLIDAYFSASKINWLLKHVKNAKEKAVNGDLCFGTIDSWLIWKLTGGKSHITDYTNASRTLLFNINDLSWDRELLDLFEVPEKILPDPVVSSGNLSETDPDLFDGIRLKINGIAGDQQAALYGQQCWSEGDLKNTYGTGCFFMMNTGQRSLRSNKGLLTTIACGQKGEVAYALEGSIFMAGAIIQWLRDELKLIKSAEETEALARSVNDNGSVYLIPAFVGLGAPYWNMKSQAALFGLSRGSSKAHIVRAGLEAIAYQAKDIIDLIEKENNIKVEELRVDGGASKNDFLMQFQSDILNIPVNRPEIIETTVLGAAMLAGRASGFWTDENISFIRKTEKLFQAKMLENNRKKLYRQWKNWIKVIVNNYK